MIDSQKNNLKIVNCFTKVKVTQIKIKRCDTQFGSCKEEGVFQKGQALPSKGLTSDVLGMS